MAAGQQRLGSLLVELGFIDEDQLQSALEEQNVSGKRLGRILVDASVITEDRLVHALSRQLGIETCDPLTTNVHERVLKLLPVEVAYRHRALPLALKKDGTNEVIYVATSDPLNKTALSDIRVATNNRRVRWLLAGETAMELALARHYGSPKRKMQPTPLPEGTMVITGKPVSAPPPARASQPPPAKPPPPRTSDLFMLSNDLDKPVTGSLAIESFGLSSADLPPIEVPPELLASPDAALQIIEAEMPRAANGEAPLELDLDPLEEPPAEAAPVVKSAPALSNGNGHRRLPPMPAPSQPFPMSWGDLIGSGDLLSPSALPWQPDPLPSEIPRSPETLEVEDDGIVVEESVDEVDPSEELTPFDPIAELAERVREATAEMVTTQPGTIVESEPSGDTTDVSGVPKQLPPEPEDELPDASLDAIPASEVSSHPIEEPTEMEVSRAAIMREVLMRFIETGKLEVGPQTILRLLAAIMEEEGLLDEARIARALEGRD